MEMNQSTYALKLRDPRWQKRRLVVFSRDGWECTRCHDASTTLALHHLSYESGREPWDYPLDNFVTLCEACHSREHDEKGRANQALIRQLRRLGFFSDDLLVLAEAFRCSRFHDPPGVIAQIVGTALTSMEACDALTNYYFERIASLVPG